MKASEEIRKLANEEIAKHSLRFFKTEKGFSIEIRSYSISREIVSLSNSLILFEIY